MKNEKSKSSLIKSIFSSAVCLASLLFAGITSPMFNAISKDFGVNPDLWRIKFIQVIHWQWTAPFALIISYFLISGSRRWSAKTNFTANVLTIVFSLLLFLSLVYI
ncbi:hypothetical protein ACFLS1_10130, partial [Verrucomicrobiota bacterium]